MKKALEKRLSENFGKRNFSRKDLYNYFLQWEGELKKGTFGWRIYNLKNKNIIREVERGTYTMDVKQKFVPQLGKEVQQIAKIIRQNFRDVKYCVWESSWLNKFTTHQFTNKTFLLETEKDLEESTAHVLSDNGFNNILWSIKGMHVSFINAEEPVMILPLISRSPTEKIMDEKGNPVVVPSLEKILVDIYKDEKVFHFIQGKEMENIFRNAQRWYCINYTTLFSYAKRRGKHGELYEFIKRTKA